jgi:DnaJ-class molecular chaperone
MGGHLYSPDELKDFRNAYFVLNIPYTTPANLIKKAYRALIKTWHPDLFPAGSRQQAQATERMKEINYSYNRIKHAPLRYHISSYPEAEERRQ